jgi:hypothetical protein
LGEELNGSFSMRILDSFHIQLITCLEHNMKA